jgi:hypothetical protein
MARITVAVEGGCAVFCGIFFTIYWVLLWPTKRAHDKEVKENQERRSLQSYIDEEKAAEGDGSEGKGSEGKVESRSPTIARPKPSRQGTTRSDRTTKGDSPIASKHVSEFKVAPAPTEEEVGDEDQPDIILTQERPRFDHNSTNVTRVDELPQEESEGPKAV